MNLVVGNITFDWNIIIPKSFDFDIVETISKSWNKNIYLFWETDIKSSKEFVTMCEEEIWSIKNYDISISSEDKVELFPYDYEEWIYEVTSFEWEEVNYDEIKDRFLEHDALFSIRECEISNKFWNKVIRVDFIY